VTEVGSAYTEDHIYLELYKLIQTRNLHLVIFSEDRIARNFQGIGAILEAIERFRITIHVVGVENPYMCDISRNVDRLHAAMKAAREESKLKSERSIRNAQARRLIKASQPRAPPMASAELLDVLAKMIQGCDTQSFYTAFNKITPHGTSEDRLGGPNFISADRMGQEFVAIKKGDFTFKDILAYLNKWNVYRKGKTNWTTTTLSELIVHHFGEEVLRELKGGEEKQDEEDEEDEDFEVSSYSHNFMFHGGQVFCQKCGRTSEQVRENGQMIPCEFK